MEILTTILAVIFVVTLCALPFVVCGLIARKINMNKGYEGGFLWGLLGIIGIIIVAVRTPAIKCAQ